MLIDIHAKSSRSQGVKIDVDTVIARALKANLDAVAFTELLSSSHCEEAIAKGEAAGLKVFIGVEIPTDKGILIGFVPEVDDFYLKEEWSALTEWTTPNVEDVMALFAEHQGALIAARHYDLDIPFNMGDMLFTMPDLHGVEVYNSRVGDMQSDFALEAATFMGLPTTGGSDATEQADKIGSYATFFIDDIATQAEFVEALRTREFWAIQLGDVQNPKTTRSSDPFSNRQSRDSGARGDSKGGRSNDKGGGGGRSGGRSSGRSSSSRNDKSS